MFDAYIFDFDGVIFDSEPIHFQACNKVFKQLGFEIGYEDYLSHYVGLSDKEMFPLILANKQIQINASLIPQLIDQKIHIYTDIINENPELQGITGIYETLLFISNKTDKIAICSGSTKKEIESVLIKINHGALKTYFKVYTTAEDIDAGKPSPQGCLLTAKRLNVRPDRCLVIEDTPNGIAAAKAANMYVVALLTTHSRDELLKADKIVENLSNFEYFF